MTADDLDVVAALALVAFPDHYEGRGCFANRLALHPQGCFVLEAAGGVAGYMVAYPWRAGEAPALNTLVEALPDDADLIYLHDLALHPQVRGQGWSRPAVERLAGDARAGGWPSLALVAVNDAAPFWARHGFAVEESPALARKLAGYGPGARYMVRPL
ncbi:MAG: GNAT family N-acetyltransferase [Caulobacterales bacterium RIFCSPHIGHO2_01_FULL_70_19]|nr:MAG: GNAT family N-acetyltransferase [Caulobacterales bacterium RIFCSPHIGHO2_01_FULL_70_19]